MSFAATADEIPVPRADRFPPQIKYIIGNEACERFSFYGMRAILATHLATLFALRQGLAAREAEATA